MSRPVRRWYMAVLAGCLSVSLLWPAAGRSEAAASQTLPYQDIGTSYARDAILNLYKNQLMNGTGADTFSPLQPMTRAEFTAVLTRMLKLKPVASVIPSFRDVHSSSWYYGTVEAASQLDLVSGTGDRLFAPAAPLSRQEAAVLINRIFAPGRTGTSEDYTDQNHIAGWARSAAGVVHDLGLMTGDSGKFRPTDSLTRQEAAVLLNRIWLHEGWSSQFTAALQPGIQMGWQYGQTTSQYKQSVQSSMINTLSPRWLYVEQDGTLQNYSDSTLVTWAHQQNKRIWAMVGNHSNQAATHTFLSNTAIRQAAVSRLTAAASSYQLDGLNIDFENVAPVDRSSMTLFVSELAAALHRSGKMLSVNVSPDLGTDWTAAFDYQALGQAADYVILMGYDEHWSGRMDPGPVASLSWVSLGLDRLQKQVRSSKIILAMPFYNRNWTLNADGSTASSSDITLGEQAALFKKMNLSAVWDSSTGGYTTQYWNGVQHKLWLEDSRSLTLKYRNALERGTAGFAYWYNGGETPDIWSALSNAQRWNSYHF
ncbi:S-layer homology domain-containing protein [Paenibacillus sp. JX-17]|uniref:S-layer homology domain-containing protein n=1 Tax=Paenibacillus lacisoli TaxID=3064525 RepID=A0ABT9C8N5_9BACL|nr:S-layer homology domain-containing protein [Paenibacillus sp. JX-17]MDO7905627.1 S-layer homology domain-containing protein [Paenibacillus sp. JX-17]